MLLHILLRSDFILRWRVHLHSFEYHTTHSCPAGGRSDRMGQPGKVAWAVRLASDRERVKPWEILAGPQSGFLTEILSLCKKLFICW